ncbi:sugar transferase [Candidatus Uhrbacteria bacterium]|nr:MAG: sugar transferase [Candidatus Uhrbacteria bacterium]
MRRLDLVFASLLLPLDFLALVGAAVTAYALRYSRFFTEIRPILTDIPFNRWLSVSVFFALIWMALFALAGLYRLRGRRAWNTLGRVILACTAGAMIVIATVFFRLEWQTSRFLVLAVWALAIVYVSFFRLFLHLVRKTLLRARIGHQRLVIVGHAAAADDLVKLYRDAPWIGVTVERHLKTWNDAARKELGMLARKNRLDVVLLADTELERKTALDLIAFAEENHLEFRYLADLFSATFTRVEMDTTGGIPVLQVKRTPLDGWGRIAKRLFDIVVSLLLLLIVAPILLVFAILLLIEDGWPVVFMNERIGERGRSFRLFKLRSMYRKYSIGPQFGKQKEAMKLEQKLIKEKSIKEGPVYKIADDPRVTPVGRFIRRWSIDELPQFFNVLTGDMSLVGPRPHQPREVEKYAPHHRRVLAIKPGITGMAQISGRSDLEFEDEVRLDAWYIENWSPLLDMYILLKTPWAVLKKKGAY